MKIRYGVAFLWRHYILEICQAEVNIPLAHETRLLPATHQPDILILRDFIIILLLLYVYNVYRIWHRGHSTILQYSEY